MTTTQNTSPLEQRMAHADAAMSADAPLTASERAEMDAKYAAAAARKASRRVPCPKCSGTGTVARFLDHDGGICYDCDGRGTIPAQARQTGRKLDPRKVARAVGDAVRAGQDVADEDAQAAWEFFEDTHPTQWVGNDCDRRNALGRRLGLIY